MHPMKGLGPALLVAAGLCAPARTAAALPATLVRPGAPAVPFTFNAAIDAMFSSAPPAE